MRSVVIGFIGVGLALSACGSSTDQRAATGGLTGAGVGAVVGGPIGAVVGGVVGAAGGAAAPEGADQVTASALHKERVAGRQALGRAGLGPQSSEEVKQAQGELQRQGLYNGEIDGIAGPETRQAVREYQQREGLQQTARLDRLTLQHMNIGSAAAQASNPQPASGTSTAPGSAGDQVTSQLQSAGYENVRNVHRRTDGSYSARADKDGQTFRLRVDPQTGQVTSRQVVAGNHASSGQSGTPPSPSNNPPSSDNRSTQ